jgi:hypothetical protein
MKYTVYALIDPTTGDEGYIGMTCRPLKARLSSHISGTSPLSGSSPSCSPRMRKWLRSLLPLRPTIEPLDEGLTREQAETLERVRISDALFRGKKLVNFYKRPDQRRLLSLAIWQRAWTHELGWRDDG